MVVKNCKEWLSEQVGGLKNKTWEEPARSICRRDLVLQTQSEKDFLFFVLAKDKGLLVWLGR